tara:strand:+ start:211 stop:663 length:453 start_codon:yes stop_codon:yes gene_type:complete
VWCVIHLSACSSISQPNTPEKSYIGKLNLSQNNLVSNFMIRVNIYSEDTIIQVSKPILGNLLKIKFNKNQGIAIDQEIDDNFLTLLSNFNKKEYSYFFNSCFNYLNIDQNIFKITKNKIELKCEYRGPNTFSVFFVNNDIFSINGIFKSE